MECSDKGFSSSTSSKPSAIPKFSPIDAGGADENDQNYDQMASKLQNPKKPPMKKHFMSPTISAASKGAAPRKKILAERNEASSDSDHHSLDRSSSRATPVYSRASDSDDDEQNTFVSDSSSKPYDPSTNYLSPRPKFMRYKPNRRREIFLDQEHEIRKEKDGSGVKRRVSFDSQRAIDQADSSGNAHSSSEPSSSSPEGSVKQEDGEINTMSEVDQDDDADEETEEFEKETCLNLKSVLKFLLVFVILFLSTFYTSSMNSPTPSPTLQDVWGLKDGYHKIRNHIFEVVTVKIFEAGSGSLGQTEWTPLARDDGSEEEVTVEDVNDELGEEVEIQNGQSEDVCDHELDDAEEVSTQWQGTGTAIGEDGNDVELEKKEEGSVGFQREETAEIEDFNDHNSEKTRESSDQLKGIEAAETAEKSDPFQDYRSPSISDWLDHLASEDEVHSCSSFKDGQVEAEDKTETSEGLSVEGAGKEVVENKMERTEGITEDADGEIVMPEGIISQGEVNSVEVTIKHSKTELIPGTVIGFFIFFVIMALSILGFHLRRKKTTVKQSLSMEKSLSKSVLAEKISSVGPVIPNLEEEHIEKIESFANPSSLIRSTEEASKEFYQSRPPTVELLGEFVVGEASSSSLKSCGVKSKMMEIEVMSSNSGFQEKGLRKKGHVVSSQVLHPSGSEFSITNSPSYGSFTAEKKIVKKEEGKDGEVRMVVTTPVRRSSRIHCRAVMSP